MPDADWERNANSGFLKQPKELLRPIASLLERLTGNAVGTPLANSFR
jgi:hypothetical protein